MFKFTGDDCDREVKGEFDFEDVTVKPQVSLRGEVIETEVCDFFSCANYCFEDEVFLQATYTSQNHDYPGDGKLTVCLRDGRQGFAKATQYGYVNGLFFKIISGPYAGYVVEGSVEGTFTKDKCQFST